MAVDVGDAMGSFIHVSVEQLGICTNNDCGEVFSLGELTPHQAVGRKCEWCGRPLTWGSLGRESVGVGGIYHKVRWVGPGGVWVDRKPEESFNLTPYYVICGFSFEHAEYNPPPSAIIRQHVVWCQKWKAEKSKVVAYGGFSLHKTITEYRAFLFDMKGTGFFPDGNSYQSLVSSEVFEKVRRCTKEYGALFDITYPAPAPYVGRNLGENVFELIIAA